VQIGGNAWITTPVASGTKITMASPELKYKKEILLANSEAHRFAVAYHKNLRARNFLK